MDARTWMWNVEHESGTCSGTMMWVLGHPGDFHSLWWGFPSCARGRASGGNRDVVEGGALATGGVEVWRWSTRGGA